MVLLVCHILNTPGSARLWHKIWKICKMLSLRKHLGSLPKCVGGVSVALNCLFLIVLRFSLTFIYIYTDNVMASKSSLNQQYWFWWKINFTITVLLLVIIMIQSNRKRTNQAQWLHVDQIFAMIIIMTFSIRNQNIGYNMIDNVNLLQKHWAKIEDFSLFMAIETFILIVYKPA